MLICHCHRVSDQKIEAHVRAGAETVGQIGKSCKAGTECGGCVPAIRQILTEVSNELVAQRNEFVQYDSFQQSLPVAAE